MGNKTDAGSTAANAGGAAYDAGKAAGNIGADTASTIAQINAAAEAMNAINLATTLAQLRELGPKNMKSLTQG